MSDDLAAVRHEQLEEQVCADFDELAGREHVRSVASDPKRRRQCHAETGRLGE